MCVYVREMRVRSHTRDVWGVVGGCRGGEGKQGDEVYGVYEGHDWGHDWGNDCFRARKALGLGQSSLTKLSRMLRSLGNQLGFTALQPQRCSCEQYKLRDMRYMVDMRDMRDKVR